MLRQSVSRLSVEDNVSPFGCCNYFDACTDELLTLTYQGVLGILDWMNFQPTDVCYRSVEFITFKRPEQSQEADTPGYLSDPCTEPYGTEIGTRKITVEDFGLLGRSGPTRDVRKQHIKYCKTTPRYRLDGTPVTSEDEWDMLHAMDVMLLDNNRMVVVGNAAVAGQYDGLQQWVATTHGGSLNSYVVDWNGNPMTGGAGITVNGNGIAATYDLIDVLLVLFRNIMQRIGWNGRLAQQLRQMRVGDMILLLPTGLKDCLLDFYTCWSVCEGGQYNEVNMQTMEARKFRNNLVAATNPFNLYGAGYITLDGIVIPLMTHDWEMINGPTQYDMYFLTGSIGNVRLWEGEMLEGQAVVDNVANLAPQAGYFSTDGGRVVGLVETDMLCKKIHLWHSPRLFCLAPWAQMRFQDIQCNRPGGPLSPDPADTSFYPETSFDAAEC